MEETKYKIETTSPNEATLMINAYRLACALYDVMSYNRALYNGKEYDVSYVYKNKIYSNEELEKLERPYKYEPYNNVPEEERVQLVLTDEQVTRKLDDCLKSVQDLIYEYFE